MSRRVTVILEAPEQAFRDGPRELSPQRHALATAICAEYRTHVSLPVMLDQLKYFDYRDVDTVLDIFVHNEIASVSVEQQTDTAALVRRMSFTFNIRVRIHTVRNPVTHRDSSVIVSHAPAFMTRVAWELAVVNRVADLAQIATGPQVGPPQEPGPNLDQDGLPLGLFVPPPPLVKPGKRRVIIGGKRNT